jgi:hypothetical protein
MVMLEIAVFITLVSSLVTLIGVIGMVSERKTSSKSGG